MADPVPLVEEAGRLEMRPDKLTGVEAATVVMYQLSQGMKLTQRLVAAMTGLSPDNSGRLLAEMSRVAPIYSEEGEWRIIDR